jgi:hypothetical protein
MLNLSNRGRTLDNTGKDIRTVAGVVDSSEVCAVTFIIKHKHKFVFLLHYATSSKMDRSFILEN